MSKTVVVGLTVAVLFGLPVAECVAQNDSTVRTLAQGARVRIEWSQPPGWHLGTAVEVGSAGFLFRPNGPGANRQIEFSALKNLQVSTGTHSRWGRGLLIGLVGGAGLGYVLGSTGKTDVDFSGYIAVLGGIAGGVFGTLFGVAFEAEDWVKVPIRE
jgi:hypothetical protein